MGESLSKLHYIHDENVIMKCITLHLYKNKYKCEKRWNGNTPMTI
jgi:hypothetical protein